MQKNHEFSLSTIKKFNFNEIETLAYKVGLYWIVFSQKIFPDYLHEKSFPKNTDPRKSLLFKYCYKLVSLTKDSLKEEEYKFYVKAQLDMIKANIENPIVSPSCLISKSSWIRWKIWKKEYEKRIKNILLSKGERKEENQRE